MSGQQSSADTNGVTSEKGLAIRATGPPTSVSPGRPVTDAVYRLNDTLDGPDGPFSSRSKMMLV